MDELLKLITTLGIGDAIRPIISLIVIAYLLKKYFLSGIATFVSDIITQYFERERERIKLETQINDSLMELTHQFESLTEALWEERRVYGKKFDSLEALLVDLSDKKIS